MPEPDINLSAASKGSFICTRIDGKGDSQVRMKSLGICIGRALEVVNNGDPMIVQVCGSQIGLSRGLASSVSVQVAQSSKSK